MPASCSHFWGCLQVFAVLQWVFSFLELAQVCLALLLLAPLGGAWTLEVLYLVWLYGDRDTPQAEGRRSAWVRNWAIWRHFQNYFPISLVKTTEMDPSHNYLFGFHPHGVLVIGAFSNLCTEAMGFSHTFPGLCLHLLMLPCWFHLPLFRDYIMCSGLVSSSKASAAHLSWAGGGQVAVLAVGGPLEALEAKPGALSLGIRNQKGSVKLVLEHRASLVPVFSFGENELFQQFPNPPGSWVRRAQEVLQRVLSVALPLFHGLLGLLLSFRTPVYTVDEPRPARSWVGAPVPVQRSPRPSRAQVDALHALYVERLVGLLEEHRGRYRIPADLHLVFT